MKMRPKEFDQWTKIRAKGSIIYAVKTATISTLMVLALYILTNAYENYDNLDAYIHQNFVQNALSTAVISLVTYVSLIVVSFVFYFINECRYKKSADDHIKE